jgi:hypothetical protein
LDEAKEVWTTLRMAHEGSKPIRKVMIDMLEGQLNRLIMFDDETPSKYVQPLEEVGQQGKAFGVQELDRSYVHRVHDEGLHTDELQRGCLDPPRPHLQEDVI